MFAWVCKSGVSIVNTVYTLMDQHHRAIIYSLGIVVVFFTASCTFHDVIPICHYLFGCDHHMHVAT